MALYASAAHATETGATMPRLITSPTSIPVPGGKVIEEYVGAVNTQTDGVSIAHMRAPADWQEPFQTPEFDEYTLVLAGSLRIEHDGGHTDVTAGQAILTGAGERVRYSTLEACDYVAICLPAFTPDRVQREDE
jgi:mannose-6-phosphate isomerase-like protein (cupin superfamily)